MRILALAAVLAAASATAAEPLPAAADAPAAAVVSPMEIRAQLKPKRYTTLAAEIGAKVRRIAHPEGSVFSEGEVLAEFDCTVQEAQLASAQAALFGADKSLESNRKLEQVNSASKLEVDLALAEADKARADVAQLKAMVQKCKVIAPFAGVVAEQKVREQQFLQPGQTMLEIVDASKLEVEFMVPSRWMAWMSTGTTFRIHVDELRKNFVGRVTRIGVRADAVSQSIKLVGELQDGDRKLRPGMSGRISFSRQQP